MDEIYSKLDKINENINEIKISQSRTEIIMDEHIRRTALNEENINLLRQEFKPVKKHVTFINNIFIFISAIGAIIIFLKQVGLLEKLTSLF